MKFNTLKTAILLSSAFMFSLLTTKPMQAATDDLKPALSFTVTRSDDRNNGVCLPGDCSLREAVNAANASATDDTIDFASGLTTVTLTNEIVIGNGNTGALAINGPGANILTIDGGPGTNRIFTTRWAAVTISDVTLKGGDGTGADTNPWGGAIEVVGGAVTLDGVHVEGNTVSGYGGGVFFNDGTHRVINSTISGNTARSGGGIAAVNGSLAIVNSTISGNISNFGGGLSVLSYDGLDVSLRNVTITNNTATSSDPRNAGGLYSYNAVGLDIGNTIVAGNSGAGSSNNEIICYFCGGITSVGGNLFGDSPGDSNIPGLAFQPTDIRDTDPMLGTLQNNGGTPRTHALLAGSPIIDKGLNALVSPLAPDYDQRGTGFVRIRDGNGDGTATVDIGAFEVQPVNVASLEELYSAVNNPQNTGMHIIIAPGVYYAFGQ
jgi:CSLREA domain-containing protein